MQFEKEQPENLKPCSMCGTIVSVQKSLDGSEVFLPVRVTDIDIFLHDRLRRAERIIVDLRAQLKAQLGPA